MRRTFTIPVVAILGACGAAVAPSAPRAAVRSSPAEVASEPAGPTCAPFACEGPIAGDAGALTQARAEADMAAHGDPAGPNGRVREPRATLVIEPVRVAESPELWAAAFTTEIPVREVSTDTYAYLALRDASGWYACSLGSAPESYDTFEALEDLGAHDILPGGSPEVSVRLTFAANGYEDGCNNEMTESTTYFAGIERGRAVLYGGIVSGESYTDCDFSACEEECEVLAECCEDIGEIHEATTYDVVDGTPGVARLRKRPEGETESRATQRTDDDDDPETIEEPLRALACPAEDD